MEKFDIDKERQEVEHCIDKSYNISSQSTDETSYAIYFVLKGIAKSLLLINKQLEAMES